MLITSTDNNKIKYINKLKNKKFRDSENKFIIETFNLIEEAEKENLLCEVFLLEDEKLPFDVSCPIYYVTEIVMNKIKSVNTSKVVGVCRKKEINDFFGKRILLLDGVGDPGNLGTIIRSSVAFDVDTIVLSLDSCDLYNDKVIRASEGAIFKINIIRKDLKEVISEIKDLGINIYGTDVSDGIDVSSINSDGYAVIMGNEGKGISEEIKKLVDQNIYIKTNNVESLNVGVAASIILYELGKDK